MNPSGASSGIIQGNGGNILSTATSSRTNLVKNEQLAVAREYLDRYSLEIGYISDEILLELIKKISKAKPAIYEPGDFVVFNLGMGETGHGTIRHVSGGAGLMGNSPMVYGIDFWFPDGRSHLAYVGEGDIKGLSTPEKALEYHKARSA